MPGKVRARPILTRWVVTGLKCPTDGRFYWISTLLNIILVGLSHKQMIRGSQKFVATIQGLTAVTH